MNNEDNEMITSESQDIPATQSQSKPAKRMSTRAGAAAGALLVGGGALVALLGPLSVNAESPSPNPSSSPTTTTAPATTPATTTAPAASGAPDATAGTDTDTDTNRGGPGGGRGGHNEAVTDVSVAATAIGISEANLTTAIQSGKTIAAVATANSVDPQKVIDALTQDGLSELAAAVTAGTITQAQADAQKAAVATRAADQVNNTDTDRGGDH